MSTATKPNHIGRKIGRIRELRGMKQEALAMELGISQQSVSLLEQSETIEEEKLEKVAKALGVTAEAIKNFSEESVLNIISNSFHDNSVLNGVLYNPTFNPIDKIIEQSEKIEELYKKLLAAEKEKNLYLEKLLNKK
ncbi:helix-turn-helix transcriptional regulator [Arenibacter sp. M-2]|uniref:helix-turn-helix domain-containing protein n=1 Tax=unclassified Arenibacter TaxID=2615047 RepID=UPI001FF3ED33|nr:MULTISPECIES: helix-turn-helix transcriptional regulator [unclassified Arenibacter]MCK0136797.1 helix-turn-helix transcriptional regulator [Arenibacter sp. S6351L]MDL5511173.1 helix-turn-helix transcriptional regulator [Arenibacter sp. M-2]